MSWEDKKKSKKNGQNVAKQDYLVLVARNPYPQYRRGRERNRRVTKVMASVKIVGLVAAHFSSEGRRDLKDRFHGCLDSIVDQSRPLDKFYLSWSHDEDIEWDVKSDIRDRFEEFKNKMSCRCEILEQGQRMQQFEHYQILYKFMEEEGCYHEDCNNRLIFGDIDDFWDPKRVEVVYDTIFASLEKDMFVIQISSKYDKYGTHIDPYGTHIDPDGIEKGKYEYWLTIIKFSIFAKFFKEADERYLKSPWCDLAFGNLCIEVILQVVILGSI